MPLRIKDQQIAGCFINAQHTLAAKAFGPGRGDHRITLYDGQRNRAFNSATVGDFHPVRLTLIFNLRNGIVDVPFAVHHPPEEPVQVLLQGLFQRLLQIPGLRMPELPPLVVGMHSAVQGLSACVAFQQIQSQWRQNVRAYKVVDRLERVGMGFRRLMQVSAGLEKVAKLPLIHGGAAQQVVNGTVAFAVCVIGLGIPLFIITIQPLVHPGVVALIGGQDAVEPVVPYLMRDDHVQRLGTAHPANIGDHRVLHAAARAQGGLHSRSLRIGVFPNLFGVKLQCPLDVKGPFVPVVLVFGCEKCPGLHGFAGRQGSRIVAHLKALVGKPGEVVHIFGRVHQGFEGFSGRWKSPVCILRKRLPAECEQALALGLILQSAGSAHLIVFRQGDADFVVAKFRIKLAHVEVGHGVPAFVVIHGRLGIPLCDGVALVHMAEAGEDIGQIHPEWGVDFHLCIRGQRLGKHQNGNINMLWVVAPGYGLAIRGEAEGVYAAELIFTGKVEVRLAHAPGLFRVSGLLIAVGIGPQVEVEGVEGFRGIIVVNEVEMPVQYMRLIVEADINAVVGLLLEVGGLGEAAKSTNEQDWDQEVETHTLSCGH